MENSSKSTKEQKFDNERLRAAIMLSVDIESNFRLFSYRCIPNEAFFERTRDLVTRFTVLINEAARDLQQSEIEFENGTE